jgi:Protein of unknown function, DUF488
VSYPGTRESVNFRGARKPCQIRRKSQIPMSAVPPKNKTEAVGAVTKRAAPAKAESVASKRVTAGKEKAVAPHSVAPPNLSPSLTVFTIGHSTRSIEEFLSILEAHGVERLVDVRTIPKSRRVPQFNSEALATSLREQGIEYVHLKSLGGLRKAKKDSVNTGWRNASFRGYADYMAGDEFRAALERLLQLASEKRTAIMCAEAVPWRCHRSLIGDALLVRGVKVEDILTARSRREHELTSFAKVLGVDISYPAESEHPQQAKLAPS